ncbi:MAG: HAMP domain-containing histidine kinase, partial [Planctomycetaceae bacterium]|nr:HAMP domain-containing histidine kinase [Planctomycetaceae bacterium]
VSDEDISDSGSWVLYPLRFDRTDVGELILPSGLCPEVVPANLADSTSRILHSALTSERNHWDRKLESLAEFCAGAGHEINNPLGTITGRVEQLLSLEENPERRRLLTQIGGQCYRIRDMIGDTMLFARPPIPCPVWNHLAEVCRETLQKQAVSGSESGGSVTCNISEEAAVWADPVQLRVVLNELLRNALEATQADGEILIAFFRSDLRGRHGAVLSVSHSAGELSFEEWEHCLDPFYSGKSAGRGLGFGLSKCWRIVTQHAGTFRLVRQSPDCQWECWFPDPGESQAVIAKSP